MSQLVRLAYFCTVLVTVLALSFDGHQETCYTLKSAIADSVTAAGISFFADHPRENATFDPNVIEPFTPSVLIKSYYGDEASPIELTKAILTMAYAAEQKLEKPMDRDDMRRNLYKYIKAGSYEYAREKAGHLLRVIADEFVHDDPAWKQHNCITEDRIYDVLEVLEIEYYRILNEVGDVVFGHFLSLGIGSTLAFAIDDTGSMGGEIEAAKARAQKIVEYTRGTLDAPQDFVLAPFNDPGVGPLTVTNDANEYHNALSKLYAHGGGDGPELAMQGIQLAVENSRPGSIVYVITDADPKDYRLQDTVVAQARQKSIIVTFLLTQQLRHCPKDGAYKRCLDLYEHVARETGGKVLVIGRGDIFRATDIVQTSTKQGVVVLKKVTLKGNSTKPHNVAQFYVDSTVQELLFQAQGNCKNIYLSLPGQNTHLKIKSQRYGNVWASEVNPSSLNKTWVGQWKMGVDVDRTTCKVSVQAKTAMGYVFTLFSKHRDAPNDSFKVLRSDPSLDSSIGVVLDGYGTQETTSNHDRDLQLKCVSQRGKVLYSVKLPDPSGNEIKQSFDSSVTQSEPFFVMIEGKDGQGDYFQRMHPVLITPSHVRIQCDLSNLTIVAGSTISSNITITNRGPHDRFVLSTSDEHSVSSFHDTSSASSNIARNGKLVKRLKLNIDEKAREGTAIQVIITARGSSPGSFQYAKCTFVVGQKKRPRIDSFAVSTTINARLAETVVTSVVTNNAAVGREAEFDMLLPKAAFITAIRIELQNETIHGVIEEKKKAAKIYERAKEIGTVAGHVASRDSSTRSYRTSMFVEPGQKVRFVLTYQEFLIRARERYEYAVILKPDQPIRSLTVDVYISEEKPLSFVRVAPLKTTLANIVDKVPPGSTITFSRRNHAAHVHYRPDLKEQTKWSPKGMSGTFIIEYDVQRQDAYGEIAVSEGYFTHFFPPPNLPPLPKMVAFVVDTSGSMYGYKIKQVKSALSSILRSLQPNDMFKLIFFGDEASSPSDDNFLKVTDENINEAITFIDGLKPIGGTNVESAFDFLFEAFNPFLPPIVEPETEESSGEEASGTEFSGSTPVEIDAVDPTVAGDPRAKRDLGEETDSEKESEYAKMAVFLTDGRPSDGETDTKKLRTKVKNENQGRFALHTIGLGSLVDFDFLKKLAHENGGTSRRIFEGIDANVQIRNFFEEISKPILNDVTIDYPHKRIEDLTENTFSVLLGGSELVVAGRIRPFSKAPPNVGDEEDLSELDVFPAEPALDGDFSSDGFLITAQIRGKRFSGETETIDFDLDPRKTSKIDESNRKIKNFTEKLWSFLTLKELLLNASIEENKTAKEEINSRALNMSLKYGFVTPLTSLVVVRSDERAEIDKQLKAEEDAAAKKTTTTTPSPFLTTTRHPFTDYEEMPSPLDLDLDMEYSYDLVEPVIMASRVADDIPEVLSLPTRPRGASVHYAKPKYRSRSRGGGGRGGGGGGFSGDPHFIIPVQPGVNICFNWDGTNGQIYNFIYDPRKMIVVNGMLVNAPAPPGGRRRTRTYVSTLAIVDALLKTSFLITPRNVTIVTEGEPNMTIVATTRFTVDRRDKFTVRVIPQSHGSSEVYIDLNLLSFKITLHRRPHSPFSCDHLDFSMLNDLRSLSPGSDGVFGQFTDLFSTKEDAPRLTVLGEGKVDADGHLRNELYIRGKFVSVMEHERPLPDDHEKAKCWFLHRNGIDAMKRRKSLFQISKLFEIPLF